MLCASLSSTTTWTSRSNITPSYSSRSIKLEVLVCSSCLLLCVTILRSSDTALPFLLSLDPFDVTVVVNFPDPEGTSFKTLSLKVCRLPLFRVVVSSDACISGYRMPLPPTPRMRFTLGRLAVMRDKLVTALNKVRGIATANEARYMLTG